MKAVKFVFKLLVCLVVLLLAAVLALPLWFGPVAKTAANSVVPGIVKTDFRVGHLSLNPYTARFELGDFNLGNPTGYTVKDAVRVGKVIVDAETMSLMTDVIHVEEISICDLFVSVVTGGEKNTLNFLQIKENVSGGKKVETNSAEAKNGTVDVPTPEKQAPAEQKAEAEKPAKKVIIDRFEVSGLTLQLSVLPIRLPKVVLTDIGRKSGGATLDEAWQQILDGVMKSANVSSDQLKALGIAYGDTLKKANEAVSQATKAMDDANKKLSETTAQATKVMDDANRKLSETTSQATKATESLSSTLKAVTGKSEGAASSGTKAVDDGVKAVGDGAKKALDSLKGLW